MSQIPQYEKNLLEQTTLSSKEKDIVEAFLRLSERIGVAQVTLQKLANELNISLGSIHYYFGKKDRPGLEETAVRYVSQESIKFINFQMDRSLSLNHFKGVDTYIETLFDWGQFYPHHIKFWLYFFYLSTHDPIFKRLADNYIPLIKFRIEHVLLLGSGLGLYPQLTNLESLSEKIHASIMGHIILSGMSNERNEEAKNRAIQSAKILIQNHIAEGEVQE